MSELTIENLAERWGVDASTIRRWRLQGRLPEPSTGPRQRGIRWSEAAIATWEAAGFTHDTEQWRADLKLVDFAKQCMGEVCKLESIDAAAVGLARAGLRVLNNPLVPLKARVEIARQLLSECDWSKALGKMDAGDRVKAAKVRHLLNTLHHKHGGQTNA